jgi:hypothetical protein
MSSAFPHEWLMWALQLVMLQSHATFVHCAAVEKDGEAILFPSWGGVGKTAIATSFVRDDGWKLMGDDLVLLSQDRTCLPFPKSMVLYPYHSSIFPELFADGRGPVAPEGLTGILGDFAIRVKPMLRKVPKLLEYARQHNPQSVRVPPTEVFGEDAISDGASVRAVVWLDRDSTISKPSIEKHDGLIASRTIGSTLSEFDRRCVSATPILCGLGITNYQEIYPRWSEIVQGAFKECNQWIVSLPKALPVAEVPCALKQLLVEVGVLPGG